MVNLQIKMLITVVYENAFCDILYSIASCNFTIIVIKKLIKSG